MKDVYIPAPYSEPSLSKDHQTVTIINHCCYWFDGFGRMKTKYVVFCLNPLAK